MNTPEWIEYQSQFDLPASYFQNIPEKTRKYCVIIEPRCHERLIVVIKNFMYLLQTKGWGLIVFHSGENETFVKEGLANWVNVVYIKFTERNINIGEYNDFMCSPQIWQHLISADCNHALFFQTDTALLKDTVDDFLEYDYIGAPWGTKWLGLDIGNGGLSIRNVLTMLMISRQCSRSVKTQFGERFLRNEDVFFSYHLAQQSRRLPSVETALKFSIETIFYEDPCGIHQPHYGNFPSYEAFANLFSKRYVNMENHLK
jgi:hypothetical protein